MFIILRGCTLTPIPFWGNICFIIHCTGNQHVNCVCVPGSAVMGWYFVRKHYELTPRDRYIFLVVVVLMSFVLLFLSLILLPILSSNYLTTYFAICGGLTPASDSTTAPTVGRRESEEQEQENSWVVMRTLASEAKLHMQAKQNTEFIHYFSSAGRCLAASWKAAQLIITWEDKLHNHKLPFLPCVPQTLIAEHDVKES